MTLEREAITQALRDAKGNISKTAKILGCSRRTLQNRMREYGMTRGRSGRPKRRLYGKKRAGWAVAGGVAVAGLVGVALLKRGSRA
jgi:hypothetical protein